MRRSFLAFAAGVLLLASASMRADELVYARLGDYLDALRVQAGIPGLAAAVVGPTDVLWERGFGYQDIARALPMRPDTPVSLDGLTQVFTATFILQCAEANRLLLDDPVGAYVADAPEPGATVRQLLSHTNPTATSLAFSYRPERLGALDEVVRRCEGASYRSATAHLLERLAMVSSAPGPDVLSVLPPPGPGEPDTERAYYAAILDRQATPYMVDSQRRAYQTQLAASTLTPATGLLASAHDYAQFDLALRGGILVQPDTLADAWRAPVDSTGKPLPHALGWFVQSYNGDPVIWQFGSGGESGSSSLAITLPTRGVTLVLLANSTGLVKSVPLAKGDVTTSPFARIFLSLFTR
jgi:CubicO group peptidase (beta-lactamase class C family)